MYGKLMRVVMSRVIICGRYARSYHPSMLWYAGIQRPLRVLFAKSERIFSSRNLADTALLYPAAISSGNPGRRRAGTGRKTGSHVQPPSNTPRRAQHCARLPNVWSHAATIDATTFSVRRGEDVQACKGQGRQVGWDHLPGATPVSYTHLTLPTILLV